MSGRDRDPRRSVETAAERERRYAARDVLDKLGVKPGLRLRIDGAVPADLAGRALERSAVPPAQPGERADIVLFAPASAAEVLPGLRAARAAIAPAGAVWLISGKRAAATAATALPYIRDVEAIALGAAAGLVDNKICSVSETVTAMRFVIRRADR